MKTIRFYTNMVLGGWSPKDLERGIGGSEEKLIELAEALAKQYDVTIYMNGEHGECNGVKYEPHRNFKPWMPCDLFVAFKERNVLDWTINAEKVVYLSTEMERDWPTSRFQQLDKFYTISNYHKRRSGLDNPVVETSYLWADLDRLERNKVKKEKGTMLYSSSFDRGLEELLVQFDKVKEALGIKKLYISYGWEFINRMINANPQLGLWKERMQKLMDRPDVEFLDKLSNDEMCKMYWKSEYWCLPLNNPDSELFCINAIKAQFCEAKPVVRRTGALQETVNDFIDWDSLMGQQVGQSTLTDTKANKKHAKKFSLDGAVKRWVNLIESQS